MLGTWTRLCAVTSAAMLVCCECVRAALAFTLKQNHSGSNFLDNWTFYDGTDPDSFGDVLYQTEEQAQQVFAAVIYSSTVGNSKFGRNSVRMVSSYTISAGSLVLFGGVHMPFGCSVWSAFWTRGQSWPDDGEIDIIEWVNLMTQNQVSLHTLDGCTHPDDTSSSSIETGTLISTDCFNQTNGNQGCIVQIPGASYGQPFSSSGGGVYALNWNTSGLYMWFFPRSSIPSDLPTENPNPDGWGLPTAMYPTSSCDASKFLKPQNLILDINICGAYASAPDIFGATCSGLCTDLVQTPSNYDNAYFEISYIRVFEQAGGSETTSDAGSATTGVRSIAPTSSDARQIFSTQALIVFIFSIYLLVL